MTEKNACYTLGIAGASKVARDRHLPVIAENHGFQLVAAASRHAEVEHVRNDTDINALSIVSEETRT